MDRKVMLYWTIQLTGWTIYFLFYIFVLYSADVFKLTPGLFLSALFSIVVLILFSHGIRYIILRFNLITKKGYQIVLITLLLTTIASVCTVLLNQGYDMLFEVDYFVKPHEDTDGFTLPEFLFSVLRSITLFLLWSGFYYTFIISEKSRAQAILNLQWEASKNEIELKNLRAQLNPHFLFNSLNSIRALIGLNPDQAKVSITQLSNLLRRSINLGKMRMIPVKEELDLVKIYLELEEVRFEERLKIEFGIQSASLSCEIPPLMIQTMVENGIKHGISKSINGGVIRIETLKNGDELTIRICSTGTYSPNPETTGIGISNSQKRLAILFGENAQFNICQKDDMVEVTINIQYNENDNRR